MLPEIIFVAVHGWAYFRPLQRTQQEKETLAGIVHVRSFFVRSGSRPWEQDQPSRSPINIINYTSEQG